MSNQEKSFRYETLQLHAGQQPDPATNAREGNCLADQAQGFLETALGDQGNIALDMDATRAGIGTGGFAQLVNDRTAWLCIFQ